MDPVPQTGSQVSGRLLTAGGEMAGTSRAGTGGYVHRRRSRPGVAMTGGTPSP